VRHERERQGKFDTKRCGKISGHFFEPQDCIVNSSMDAINDNADPWECYSSGTSGVTGYHEKDAGSGTSGKVFSDACDWLAGRCGDSC
jgi:hypothetical protein